MLVEIGNDRAVEVLPTGEVRSLPGQRVTQVIVPSGVSPEAAVVLVSSVVSIHMDMTPDTNGDLPSPAWVDCLDTDLRLALCKSLGVNPKKNKRPVKWGTT